MWEIGLGSPYIWGLNGSDEHNPTCYHNCDEGDYIEYSKDVQDDVAWATQFGIWLHVEHFHGVLNEALKLGACK
jgi:hypothetical protein